MSVRGLEHHLELLRCHYNFVRPHLALKFGGEIRTQAMQADPTKHRLTTLDCISAPALFSGIGHQQECIGNVVEGRLLPQVREAAQLHRSKVGIFNNHRQ